FFFSSRRRHTRFSRDWSSDVCSSDLPHDTRVALGPFSTASAARLAGESLGISTNREFGAKWHVVEMYHGSPSQFYRERTEKVRKIGRASCRERVWSEEGGDARRSRSE